MDIEKGKTSNGYAKTLRLFRKITLMLCKGWRYFFMEITKSKRIIIKEIMYSLSIATTSFRGDDGITARLLHCFQSYLLSDVPTKDIIQQILCFFNIFSKKAFTPAPD